MECGKGLILLFFLGTVSATFPSPGFELTTAEETDPRFKTFHPYSENDNSVSVGISKDPEAIDILIAGPAVKAREEVETTRKDKKVSMKFLNSPKVCKDRFSETKDSQLLQELETFMPKLSMFQDLSHFQSLEDGLSTSTESSHEASGARITVKEKLRKSSTDRTRMTMHMKRVLMTSSGQEVDFEELRKMFPNIEGRSKSPSRPSRDIKIKRSLTGNRLENVNQPILLPASDTNRFPHSMVNNKHLRPVDIAMMNSNTSPSRSRSYVYKNMAGNGYLYSVSHNEKLDRGSNTESEQPSYNDVNTRFNSDGDVETVGPIRPPDLSRDTRVNPNGRSNTQGVTMVDPDSEVFDLSLVIKEMESRANEE